MENFFLKILSISPKLVRLRAFIIGCLGSMCLITSFIIPDSLMEAYSTGPEIWANLITLIGIALITCNIFISLKYVEIKITETDIITFISVLYLTISGTVITRNYDRNEMFNLISTFAFYCQIRLGYIQIQHIVKKKFHLCVISLILIVFLSSIYGYLQIWNLVLTNNFFFKVTGQFINPGHFSIFISSLAPFCINVILSYPVKTRLSSILKVFSFLTILLAVIIICLAGSRTALLAIVISTLILLYLKYEQIRLLYKKPLNKCLISIILIIVLAFLYSIRPDSVDGRFVIWRVCQDIIQHNIVSGIGIGNFSKQFDFYQAIFFSKAPIDLHMIKLADITLYAFNDFIQIFCEQGIIGLILFLLLIYSVLKNRDMSSPINNFWTMGLHSILIAIIVCCLFSYPLEIKSVQIIFWMCVSLLAQNDSVAPVLVLKLNVNNYFRYILGIISIGILIVFALFIYERYVLLRTWKDLSNHYASSEDLKTIYPELKSDPYFILQYSTSLINEKKYQDVVTILDNSTESLVYPSTYLNLGTGLIKTNRRTRGEYFLNLAICIAPNRLTSRLILLRHFYSTKQFNKAHKLAVYILMMTPKVKSFESLDIKNEVHQMINNNP